MGLKLLSVEFWGWGKTSNLQGAEKNNTGEKKEGRGEQNQGFLTPGIMRNHGRGSSSKLATTVEKGCGTGRRPEGEGRAGKKRSGKKKVILS